MSHFTIQVDGETGLAIISCSGDLHLEDARQAASALWETSGWTRESAVWDFRAAEFHLSSSEVREIARFILENQPNVPPRRIAFVTHREVDYGLARMFEAFRDHPATAFYVFRDYDEAIDWARPIDPSTA